MAETSQSYIKWASLVVLVFQNSSLVLLMKYSRLIPGPQYYSTTAVLICEIIKCIASLLAHYIELVQEDRNSLVKPHTREAVHWVFLKNVFTNWKQILPLAIPSFLYTIQNNLQYVAVTNLDAATFQVTYQMKILTTAVCSVFILGRSLSKLKWFSLLVLTIGIILVQSDPTNIQANKKSWVGLVAVSVACMCSGLAGVSFEKLLKNKNSSVWLRNVHMSLFCGLSALVFGVYGKDGNRIAKNGFFHGYNFITWLVIFDQAGGGLVVAVVIKYADNILKGFATSISIIISSLVSWYAFDTELNGMFLLGASLVILATYLYSIDK